MDHLTLIDREDIDRETRYAQPVAERKPEVSVHTVDDVYLQVSVYLVNFQCLLRKKYMQMCIIYVFCMIFTIQTIIEKKLIEDEERRTREVTQFYRKDEPKWDVTITNHPREPSDIWERGKLFLTPLTEQRMLSYEQGFFLGKNISFKIITVTSSKGDTHLVEELA